MSNETRIYGAREATPRLEDPEPWEIDKTAEAFLSADGIEEYKRAAFAASIAYERAKAPACCEYIQKTANLYRKFPRNADSLALAKLKKAIAPAESAYDLAIAPFYAAYKSALAAAFSEIYKREGHATKEESNQ